MSRFYRQLAVLFFVLFAVIMLVIRAQPYDDHELRALLMPDDCEMPCFVGIRPGVTTADEAVRILNASSWVDKVETQLDSISGAVSSIRWIWNVNAPLFVQMRYSSSAHVTDNRIDDISVPTTIALGDIWLSLGHSSEYGITTVEGTANSPSALVYENFYEDMGLEILGGGLLCPYLPKLWQGTIALYYVENQNHMYPAEEMHDAFFPRQVLAFERNFCKG